MFSLCYVCASAFDLVRLRNVVVVVAHSFVHSHCRDTHAHTHMWYVQVCVCVCHTFKKLTATMTPTLKAPFTVIQIPLQQVVVVAAVVVLVIVVFASLFL